MDSSELLNRAHEIARSVAAPAAAQVDSEATWPEASLRALQAAGLGGLVVPRSAGGLGQGLQMLARTCEILAQSCTSTALCFGMHCVGTAVIAAKATDDQKKRYLEPIAAGRHLTTLALSERGTGSHFYFPQTRLTPSGDGTSFTLEGEKSFVTNGGHADSYVVSAMAATVDAPVGEFSCVVVPKEAKGVQWGPEWDGMGMRGNSSCTVELRSLTVPRADLLGQEGDELWYIFEVVAPYFLTAMAGSYLGVAEAAVQEAITHLGKRRYSHSGSTLAQQQVLQHRLGTLWSQVEASRRQLYHAAEASDAGLPEALPAILSAKAEVADRATTVVNEVMTLLGGAGYGSSSKMSRLLRDVRAAHVMAPTTDILRIWTGRALLGLPLLG